MKTMTEGNAIVSSGRAELDAALDEVREAVACGSLDFGDRASADFRSGWSTCEGFEAAGIAYLEAHPDTYEAVAPLFHRALSAWNAFDSSATVA